MNSVQVIIKVGILGIHDILDTHFYFPLSVVQSKFFFYFRVAILFLRLTMTILKVCEILQLFLVLLLWNDSSLFVIVLTKF